MPSSFPKLRGIYADIYSFFLWICSENCDEKLNEFLKRTYYIDAGYDNKDGMVKLNSKMSQIEVNFGLKNCFIYVRPDLSFILKRRIPLEKKIIL